MMLLGGVAAMKSFSKERKARGTIQQMPLPDEGTTQTQPRNQHMKV